MVMERLGQRGDIGRRKPPPPTVTSVQHAGAMAVAEQDASVHRAMQEGGGAEVTALVSGGGEGGLIQVLHRLWIPPGDGDLF